ncbi:3550_t:CDS:2, partial [Acaulospora morrowiae]
GTYDAKDCPGKKCCSQGLPQMNGAQLRKNREELDHPSHTKIELPDKALRSTYDKALINADAGMLNQKNSDMMTKQINRTIDLADKIPTVQKDTGKYLGETTEYSDDDKAISNQGDMGKDNINKIVSQPEETDRIVTQNPRGKKNQRETTVHHNPEEGHKLIRRNLIMISMKEEELVQITSDRKNNKSISCSNTPLVTPNSEKMTTGHPSEDLKKCLNNDRTLKTKNDESNNSEEKNNAEGYLEDNKLDPRDTRPEMKEISFLRNAKFRDGGDRRCRIRTKKP